MTWISNATISNVAPAWLTIFWNVNGTLLIFINSLGVFAIFRYSTPEMKVYKWFLFQILCWSFLLDFDLNWLFCPISVFPLWGGAACCCWVPFFYMNFQKTVGTLVVLENCSLSLIDGFLYRWWAIQPEVWFAQSNFMMFMCCAFLHLAFITPNCILAGMAEVPREVQNEYVREHYPNSRALLDNINWMIFPSEEAPLVVPILVVWVTEIILLLVIAGFTVWRVYITLRNYRNLMSSSSYGTHLQLLKSLLIQACFPLSVYVLPVGLGIFMAAAGLEDVQSYTHIMVAVFCCHSSVNSIVMILAVKPYRNGILRKIPCFPKKYLDKQLAPLQQVSSAWST